MSGFYKPFNLYLNDIPVIVYPCIGLEKVIDRLDVNSILNHLEKLYLANKQFLKVGEYHIVILWDESSDDQAAKSADVMSDVWIFDKLESWGSGPLVDVKIFRNNTLEMGIGVSAGDGLLMLGREEERRRESKSLKDYLKGERAKLPIDISPKENFYISSD